MKVKELTDIWAFADRIKFMGGSKNFAQFHKDMIAPMVNATIAQSDYHTFLNLVPRGHLKSTVNTTLYCLWRIYRNPNIRICIAANNLQLAKSFIRQIRAYLQDETLARTVWNKRPHIKGQLVPEMKSKDDYPESDDDTETVEGKYIWNSTSIQVMRTELLKEPTVYATSVGSLATGNHYDLVIFDDVVDVNNSNKPAKREKLLRWVNDVESQLEPYGVKKIPGGLTEVSGLKVINGTPYYRGDLYDHLESMAHSRIHIFKKNVYANGVDDTDGYLWGAKYTKEIVDDLRSRLTKETFNSQYELRFIDDTKQEYCVNNLVKVDDITIRQNAKVVLDNREYETPLYGVLDIAHVHDYNVCIIGAYLDKHTFLVVDAVAYKGELTRFLDKVYNLVQEVYPVKACLIEANGVGGGVKTALSYIHQRKTNGVFKPLKFREFWQKDSKQSRLALATKFLSDCRVIIPNTLADSTFIKQLRSTTNDFDDAKDCLASALIKFPKNEVFQRELNTVVPTAQSDGITKAYNILTQIHYGRQKHPNSPFNNLFV